MTKTTRAAAKSSTSISDRNIWIPPVPALSDVGTSEGRRPRSAGPFVFGARCSGAAATASTHAWIYPRPVISRSTPCVDGALPIASRKKQGRAVPRLPAPCSPTVRLYRPLFQFRSRAPAAPATVGAIGLSAKILPTLGLISTGAGWRRRPSPEWR
ncbi:hypothetical protein CEE63_10960 [Stenotrophomonas maltophilia]|uniref:Uncharacterized protein n=1 Tax=Stenotrophomonas maltophilia TaxID=40324 RepID=A0A246I6E2_STEMA|nr:hypothetical protein CEE63_10960 [Stenotrophomonas maltophilia]